MKRVLMVAYHFPPMNVSSGIQRTLRFAQYLPQAGWEPIVLTAHARAYPSVSQASLAEVPPGLTVRRAFAADTQRHLSIGGRYPRLLRLPDRWWTWWLGAVPAGLSMIRKFRPHALWSTYPIATAHLIGATLRRLSGLPWIADFRDPMTEPGYPADPIDHGAYAWIERAAMNRAARAVFTTPGTLNAYATRYPNSRLALIENGYDEASFAEAETRAALQRSQIGRPPVLLHSGTIYPAERDPRAFLNAVAALRHERLIEPTDLRIVLRATGADDYMRSLIAERGIEDFFELKPSTSYGAALEEMLTADALLLLQGSSCNAQIPAKLYEYLRCRRPVLALADPAGDTAAVLRRAGVDTIAALESEVEIARLLRRFLMLLKEHRAPVPKAQSVENASRQARTAQLAHLLDAVVEGEPAERGMHPIAQAEDGAKAPSR